MNTFFHILSLFAETCLLLYSIMIISLYLFLAVISAREILFYLKKNSFVDYKSILSSSITPSISLLAPAYNEGKTIVENVRSLLSLHYGNYEVIIINDGSKDDCLAQMIEAYNLVKVDFFTMSAFRPKKYGPFTRVLTPHSLSLQ